MKNEMKNQTHNISTAKTMCWYLFFGTLVGDAIVLFSLLVTEFDLQYFSNPQSYLGITMFVLFSYPVALVAGGIPALISGFLISKSRPHQKTHVRAGLIALFVSIVFYLAYYLVMSKEFSNDASPFEFITALSVVGAISAIATQLMIQKRAKKLSSRQNEV